MQGVHQLNSMTGLLWESCACFGPAATAAAAVAASAAVIVTREALAQKLAKSIMPKVQDANIDIMRTHLERHTYVSGSNDDVKPSFRHYRKRQQAQRQRL